MADAEAQARWRAKLARKKDGDLEIEEFWITYEDRCLLYDLRLIDDKKDPDQIKAAFLRMLATLAKNNPRSV